MNRNLSRASLRGATLVGASTWIIAVALFTGIVGAERVIAGSDCGFGTFAGFGAVDPDIAYAKLGALSEGAKLAAGRT